jgi:hypothetical protein
MNEYPVVPVSIRSEIRCWVRAPMSLKSSKIEKSYRPVGHAHIFESKFGLEGYKGQRKKLV